MQTLRLPPPGLIWQVEMSTVSEFTPSVAGGSKASGVRDPSRRIKWIAGSIGVVILAWLTWHFVAPLFAGHRKAPPPPPVHVAQARRADVTMVNRTIASVVSPAMVQVNAQVTGKLLTAYFQEGQMVRKGDPLFLIDPAPYQAALNQVKGQLAKDQAALSGAQRDLKRYQALMAVNAESQQVVDDQAATVATDQGVVESDTANVDTAQINLGYTRIVSPVNGTTGPIQIQPGNIITVAGTTPLVTITQVQPIMLSFFLPQTALTQIQNQKAAGKLFASVPMPGAAGSTEKAPVDFVSNVVSATTGTIELRATFSNQDQRLVTGQTVNVAVTLNQLPGATVVPRDAVNVGPDSSFVYVINDKSVVERKVVKVLNDDGTNDAVKGDVKPGDKVVTEGQQRIVAGTKVRVEKGKEQMPTSAFADSDMPT
jgi:membrane fusion protein, multidrug efflux system